MPNKALYTKSEYITLLCDWLENWFLSSLSGNEKHVLSELITNARKAAQEK